MKKTIFLIIFIISLINSLYSQERYSKIYFEAEAYFMDEKYSLALPLYHSIIKENPTNTNLYYRIGLCYLHDHENRKLDKAITYLSKAAEKNVVRNYKEGSIREKNAPVELYFSLGNAYSLVNKFDSALIYYEKYRDLLRVNEGDLIDMVNRQIETLNNAKEIVKMPKQYEKTYFEDYLKFPHKIKNYPVVSADEKTIIYIPYLFSGSFYDEPENINFSQFIDGEWTTPREINIELKIDKITLPVSLSPDGKTLFLVKDDYEDGNIYISTYKDGLWSVMKQLNGNINTKYWESSASISADGKTLYFTSDRPEGYGGLDIYKSELNESGIWGPAINLGPTINSIYDEDVSAIIDDGKTLYFSSMGNYSMGGFDLFKSTYLGDNNWSVPQNVGIPINTIENDLLTVVKAQGKYFFFPVDIFESEMGNNDAFKAIEFFPKDTTLIAVKNNDTLLNEIIVDKEIDTTSYTLKGLVTLQDNMSELPNDFKIYAVNTLNYDTTYIIKPDLITGKYSEKILNGNYKLVYSGTGYKSKTERIFIPKNNESKSIVVNVDMTNKDVSTGKYYTIRNIYFDFNKYDLHKEGKIELEKFIKLIKEYPTLKIEIIGYTDSKGTLEKNKILSENRAKEVGGYLINNGVKANQIITKGVPKSNYIAINQNPDGTDNKEGRKYNRRVEIKIIKTDENIFVHQENTVPENLTYSKFNKNSRYLILIAKQKEQITNLNNIKHTENKIGDNYIYSSGIFLKKSEAINLLNKLIELGYTDARIINESEYNEGICEFFINENSSDTSDNMFTIQLCAFTKPVNKSYFKELNDVKEILCVDGFYKYIYKLFNNIDSAKNECKNIRKIGYNDAFIITTECFKKATELKQTINDTITYTIQLCSLNHPAEKNKFKDLQNVVEHIFPDNSYKYTYGKFANVPNAKKELELIIKDFPDAFISKLSIYSEKK